MKIKWIGRLTILLIILLYAAYLVTADAAGRSDIRDTDTISGVIKSEDNTPIGNAEISIFDGFTIRSIKSDTNGVYNILQLPVSADLHAVLFITKDGYVPSIINVKRREEVKADYPVTMRRAGPGENGYIAGVVYQPIKGGKIKYQSGINSFGRGKRVR